MHWISINIEVESVHVETLSEALLELGALSVSILDANEGTQNEQALFGEPGEITESCWIHNRVTALFGESSDAAALVKSAALEAGLDFIPQFDVAIVPDEDWVQLTQSQFQPISILSKLWVIPSWHKAPDPYAINIILDPGLAFGTGSHPTTRLCLKWLANHIQGGEQVLDYGCGSGILAIAAAKLGAATVTGIDIDAQAIETAQRNAIQNQVTAYFSEPHSNFDIKADIVLANILANPLKILAPMLVRYTKDQGWLILSGILIDQAQEVIQAYRDNSFDLNIVEAEEAWVCLAGKREKKD